MPRRLASTLVLVLLASACGANSSSPSTPPPAAPVAPDTRVTAPTAAPSSTLETTTSSQESLQPCADVVDVAVSRSGEVYRFDVTVRSGDTGWEKYADAWVVRTLDGEVLGERILAHPHEAEQPFTRSLSGVAVPAGVSELEIAARDSVNGFCGTTMRVELS